MKDESLSYSLEHVHKGVYFIRNVLSKTVMTVDLSTAPYHIAVGYTYNLDEVNRQLFSVKRVGKDNTYLIINVLTGEVLDLQGGETNDNNPIIFYSNGYGVNRLWNIVPSE